MTIYEETQQSIIELSPRLEEIAEQQKRIADALENLANIFSKIKDEDGDIRIFITGNSL